MNRQTATFIFQDSLCTCGQTHVICWLQEACKTGVNWIQLAAGHAARSLGAHSMLRHSVK